MTSLRVLGDLDVVSLEDLKELGAIEGPCVSIFMPTHRAGAETLQGSIRLGNLVDVADSELDDIGFSKRERAPLLVPISRLAADHDFWQHQSDGLAVYSGAETFRTFRVAISLPEEATVSGRFRIRPLLPMVSGNGNFLILALAENSIRLFEATRFAIGELDLGPIPASKRDALRYEDPENELQFRLATTDSAAFHGHGLGDEVQKEELERFFRAVDQGLLERVGRTDRPLMLACVAYYESIYRAVSRYPKLADRVVEGNPERLRPDEIHDRAWPLIEETTTASLEEAIARFHDLSGTGRAATDPTEILAAGTQGRVGTLLVGEDAPVIWGTYDSSSGSVEISDIRRALDHDLIDLAVALTIGHGGSVHHLPAEVDSGVELGAIYRF